SSPNARRARARASTSRHLRARRGPAMTTTPPLRSAFLRNVTARGQFHQCTDLEGLDAVAAKGITGYIGFDMTAPSLHVGSLTQIMLLRRLQQAGGKPIVLLGGGTTRVGDPSG